MCEKRLKTEDVAKFRDAVNRDYYFQLFLDDLPIWGFFGRIDHGDYPVPSKPKYLLLKKLNFGIFYNGDHVTECYLQMGFHSDEYVDTAEDKEMEVEFLSSVKWKKTDIPFEKRME